MQSNFDPSTLQTEPRGSLWSRIINKWYSWTTPPEVSSTSSFEQREIVRRARLASIIIFIVIIGNIPSLPPAITGPNKMLLPILGVQLLATLVAAYLNKRGRVNIAGGIIIFFLAVGMMGNITSSPVSPQTVPLFAILIIPEILAAALLPAYWIFIVAALHIIFSIFAVNVLKDPTLSPADLNFVMSYGIFLTATVQVMVAGVSFLWNLSLGKALREKDQAQEIARLERDLSEQSMQIVREKEQLEQSIGLIIQTQSRVANGDLNARVPLTQDNVLWSVAGALNNMISRLQRSRQVEHELEVTRTSASQLISLIRARKAGMQAPPYNRSGTVIDTVAMEIFTPNDPQQRINDASRTPQRYRQ